MIALLAAIQLVKCSVLQTSMAPLSGLAWHSFLVKHRRHVSFVIFDLDVRILSNLRLPHNSRLLKNLLSWDILHLPSVVDRRLIFKVVPKDTIKQIFDLVVVVLVSERALLHPWPDILHFKL